METKLLLWLLLPFAFLALGLGLFFPLLRSTGFLSGVRAPADREERGPISRPWLGNPLVWLAVAAALVVLGLVVAPQFLPGAVVFVPFIWVGGRRRRPRVRPHARGPDPR